MNTSSPQSWEKQRFVHSWMRVIRRSEAPGILSKPSRTKPTRLFLPSYRAHLSPSPRVFRRSPGKPAARTFFISVVNSRYRRPQESAQPKRNEKGRAIHWPRSILLWFKKCYQVVVCSQGGELAWLKELIYQMAFGFLLASNLCLEKLDNGGRGYNFNLLEMNDSLVWFLTFLSEWKRFTQVAYHWRGKGDCINVGYQNPHGDFKVVFPSQQGFDLDRLDSNLMFP